MLPAGALHPVSAFVSVLVLVSARIVFCCVVAIVVVVVPASRYSARRVYRFVRQFECSGSEGAFVGWFEVSLFRFLLLLLARFFVCLSVCPLGDPPVIASAGPCACVCECVDADADRNGVSSLQRDHGLCLCYCIRMGSLCRFVLTIYETPESETLARFRPLGSTSFWLSSLSW